jgi:hypothetical protein
MQVQYNEQGDAVNTMRAVQALSYLIHEGRGRSSNAKYGLILCMRVSSVKQSVYPQKKLALSQHLPGSCS